MLDLNLIFQVVKEQHKLTPQPLQAFYQKLGHWLGKSGALRIGMRIFEWILMNMRTITSSFAAPLSLLESSALPPPEVSLPCWRLCNVLIEAISLQENAILKAHPTTFLLPPDPLPAHHGRGIQSLNWVKRHIWRFFFVVVIKRILSKMYESDFIDIIQGGEQCWIELNLLI